MKYLFRRSLSAFLALSLLCSLGLTAMASDALGDDLTSKEILLNEETQLSTNVFWSTSVSDLRTEHYITYEPNRDVKPIVTYGGVLTDRTAVSTMAKELEAEGYRVVAGINGDFYNVGTGLPIGMVVTEGMLRSSDAGYYAIGFKKNGSAILGKPGVKVTADLNYELVDEYGTFTETVRQITAVNKARVSTGGIYLYTYDFNTKHTNGITEAGVDVLCSVKKGDFAIGEKVTLTVERVLETSTATTMREDQVVLSVNLQSNAQHVDALRNVPVGSEIKLTIEASDKEWEDVEYAVGALYSLVEDGQVVSGLAAGAAPRTAVGQKRDGTLIFYTIDGRKAGHSVGASLTQVAQRLIELGCETALCLDGGGSTTLSVTEPDEMTAKTINTPSEGGERAVTNQIFLVADNKASGRLSHFYVNADHPYVLAGSKVNISAAAVDTNYIPMDKSYELTASDGWLEGNELTTPAYDSEITVTAKNGSKKGSTVVYAIERPDQITIRNSSGTAVTEIEAAPGTKTPLTATAVYQHLPLKADAEAFTWEVTGGIGKVDRSGNFTATASGKGTITATAGGRSASVDVEVTRMALQTVESFEEEDTIFHRGNGDGLELSLNTAMEQVRIGYGSGKLEYNLTEEAGYVAEWWARNETEIKNDLYSSLNLWVYGDNSGNTLYLLCNNGEEDVAQEIALLDFTGWKQVSISTEGEEFEILGLGIRAGEASYVDDGLGTLIPVYPETARTGTVYLDQMVASFGGAVDNGVPEITAELDEEDWAVRAEVRDLVDDLLKKEAISVAFNGEEMDFEYNKKTGEVTAYLPGPGETHEAMRVTITARDASGNIGRASVDVEPLGVDHKFTDIQDYWGATFVDYLYTSGITAGYADGTFRPNQNITRAQFSVMLYRYLGLNEEDYLDVVLPFADLGKIPEYALPAIRALYTEGVINGSTGKDGRIYFNPNNSLTRAQAATMIGRTQEKGYASVELTFTDAKKIPAYAQFYIQTMAAQEVIGGYTDGSFKPNNNITRGQMAKILYNLM